jgi:rhodanese-related sulfurtransferase
MFGITRHAELKSMMDRNDQFVLVDVLPAESYLRHNLPGSINIPLHENFDKLASKMLLDKSTPVIVYCKNLECKASMKACEQLVEMGYKNVSDYEKGLEEWMQLGYPLDS